jgi:hypothetical protein
VSTRIVRHARAESLSVLQPLSALTLQLRTIPSLRPVDLSAVQFLSSSSLIVLAVVILAQGTGLNPASLKADARDW